MHCQMLFFWFLFSTDRLKNKAQDRDLTEVSSLSCKFGLSKTKFPTMGKDKSKKFSRSATV